ncbi:MAG: PEP-CTERM sorting domain-containing protein [Telluria sp.]
MIASAASATPVVFSTGLIQMGVSDSGALGGMGVGLIGPTGDAITPGCLCEGWGAAANGISAAAYAGGPAMGILTSSTSGAGSNGSTVTTLSNGLQVEQTYSSAAGGSLFNVHVNLKNISGAALSDVRYARTLDWDVSPGYFDNNYTTLYGGTPSGPGGKVLTTSTDPFALPDPMLTRSQNMNMNVTNVLGDLGSYFVFGFGNLATGASVDFDTYIGAGNTVKALLTSLGSVGVEAYSYTTGDATAGGDHAPAYGYGFAGLGLPPSLPGGDVPEPASIALLCLASGAMAWTRRRRG